MRMSEMDRGIIGFESGRHLDCIEYPGSTTR